MLLVVAEAFYTRIRLTVKYNSLVKHHVFVKFLKSRVLVFEPVLGITSYQIIPAASSSQPQTPPAPLHWPGKPYQPVSKGQTHRSHSLPHLKKHGRKPLQYPLHPFSCHTVFAASLHPWNLRTPPANGAPSGSVIIRCFTTSDG